MPQTFTHNNLFAYGPKAAFQKAANDTLIDLGTAASVPFALMAADPASNLAAVSIATPSRVSSYQVSAQGDLSTTSTAENSPAVNGFPYSANMSPSGELLAVGTAEGLQVFHWNGAKQATPAWQFTGPIVLQVAWDNDNHLYALGYEPSKGQYFLYVFTATPTGFAQAGGSPYAVNADGFGFVVQCLTTEE
jgi:hypothetical protein